MLKKILIAVVLVLGAFIGFVFTRPATYHVERSVRVEAPTDVVYADINSLKDGFVRWSPWEKLDPKMKRTFSGPAEGVGASYAWEGNKDVGKGDMKITESTPGAIVKEDLEFIEPFASKAVITMSLVKEGDGTKVTWALDGDNDFGGKLMSVFSSMDKMIGPDFDAGLKNLQTVAKEDADKAAAAAAPVGDPPPPPDGAVPAPGAAADAPPAKG